mmetsp:Transcript_57329/g.65689  ORF Transcript_57329/g.65689 Transcript_57329/m.65689 type:complete len:674 (+) Transcript_57329:34-2055(+)|eukprot:CAMPEP_0176466044 /NCGR_PEP_ID=MMETSP0127-20121128/37656_1 /TAXON_ID=938130 /ORGANISM="Platyophrya macrostoma, Strain WH" /LENGTH=673 /DNA_ID=CAMNT_0017859133 /DNA_START=25 /DNA_END=2046 /DNA_ORIENTATION=-
MGAGQTTLSYSTPIGTFDVKKGETPVFRRTGYEHALVDRIPGKLEVGTLQELFLASFKQYAAQPAIGTRAKLADGKLGDYSFKTYDQLKKICMKLGSGIEKLKLAPKISEYQNFSLSFLGIYSKNREEYLYVDLTAALFNHTMIPVYDTLGADAVQFVFEQTNLTTLFCSNNYLAVLTQSAKDQKLGKVTNIVAWDPYTEAEKEALQSLGVALYSLDEVLKAGESEIELPRVKADDIFVFSYTSGTTSKPKAVMLTHKNFISTMAGAVAINDPCLVPGETDAHLSYLPMAHIYERVVLAQVISGGGKVGFYAGDAQKLKEDIVALKPTFFISVPRLYNKIFDSMMDGVNKQTGMKKALVNSAIKSKLSAIDSKGSLTHGIYDSLVFSKMRDALGGKMRFMITAAAPMAPDRLKFLKVAMSCPILEGYGQTESTGGSFVTHSQDGSVGHVGGPIPSLEFKLVDVPDMKYTAMDRDEKGERCPRGEICIRGSPIFKGYYKDEEKTKEAIDEEGWLHTGDVGKVDKYGRLTIIDRKKNIFKLAQGEYIAPEKIETILLRSKIMAEVYVYGDSLQTFCVLIAVPSHSELVAFAKSKGITEEDYAKLCEDKELKKQLQAELEKMGKREGLQGFEVPKKIFLRPDSFGKDGLLTATLKLKRNEARDACRGIIDELYKEQ